MKPHLLFPDRDLVVDAQLDPAAQALSDDLELDLVLEAMAGGDSRVLEVCRSVLLAGCRDPATIRYRQAILADLRADPAIARTLYELALEAISRERRVYGGFWSRHPETVLRRSVEVIEQFLDVLRRLRGLAEVRLETVTSVGLRTLFETLVRELDDPYLASVEDHLARLRFRDGIVVTAELGAGNRGTNYVLRRPLRRPGWRERLGLPDGTSLTYEVPERDESGFRALAELTGLGVALAARAVAASAEHILDFFRLLRDEAAAYVGLLALEERLRALGGPLSVPEPAPVGSAALAAVGLYDAALQLRLGGGAVASDVALDGARLVCVTGANQGGKTTFLRALGLAELLMAAGAMVPARSFRAAVAGRIYSHFPRSEADGIRSGKLDEELERMRAIADRLEPGDLVLMNESFSSTNEREGSEIARGILTAFADAGVRVVAVTHLRDLVAELDGAGRSDVAFLRAERLPDGRRTFRIVPGRPERTSHGLDVFRRVFGGDGSDAVLEVSELMDGNGDESRAGPLPQRPASRSTRGAMTSIARTGNV